MTRIAEPAPAATELPEPGDPLLAEIWARVQRVEDPCHRLSGYPLTIADLGLVNRIDVAPGVVEIGLTYTEMGCTFAPHIVARLEDELGAIPGIGEVHVLYEPFPPWTPDRLSDRARQVYRERQARSPHGEAARDGGEVLVPFPAAAGGITNRGVPPCTSHE
jgi:metal-sulfur cluster biosynthetic enzyme